tara:strand:+ start:189 stop:776 length:588 start_codon:yes stop_codon:yes gene_type:complete
MIKGKTIEHINYSKYSFRTKNELIRNILNNNESISVLNKKINNFFLVEGGYSDEIDSLKSLIQLQRAEIKDLIELINNKKTIVRDLNKYSSDNWIPLSKRKINQQTGEWVLKEIKPKKTYLIKDNINGLYKIGYSINPKQREKTLQSEKPDIKIVKIWNKDIEKQLHKSYKEHRIRGEWFKLNQIQVKFICSKYL